jgi:hypothetical protein
LNSVSRFEIISYRVWNYTPIKLKKHSFDVQVESFHCFISLSGLWALELIGSVKSFYDFILLGFIRKIVKFGNFRKKFSAHFSKLKIFGKYFLVLMETQQQLPQHGTHSEIIQNFQKT